MIKGNSFRKGKFLAMEPTNKNIAFSYNDKGLPTSKKGLPMGFLLVLVFVMIVTEGFSLLPKKIMGVILPKKTLSMMIKID